MSTIRFFFILLFAVIYSTLNSQNSPVILKNNEGNFQLKVKGKPFIVLGGELANSATSDVVHMSPIWPKLKSMNLNAVLVPVYWELTEPIEGKYDFTLMDSMIYQARRSDLHLVLLWFGTWKNSMSCYAPEWVKRDWKRFPRTKDKSGKPSEIVSAFSKEILNADIRAFRSLTAHLKRIDATEQTVIMIQVENEIGQLPDARDYSQLANSAFNADVPSQLIDYLSKNKKLLLPHVYNLWSKNGCKQAGNWESVFGKSLATDELFTAWNFARFADQVAQAGKSKYQLPMYVNCALNRPNVEPGKYPSGGPLPHLLNIWQAAAPNIDILSPDIYHGDFRNWCVQYDRLNNPVFMPEIKQETENAAQLFYVLGRHKALGFCPFSIENSSSLEAEPLRKSYKVVRDISDLLLANQMYSTGVYLDKEHKSDTLYLRDYQIIVSHVCTLPWTDGAKAEKWTPAGCIIFSPNNGEFWIAGTSVTCTFKNVKEKGKTTGILSADVCTKDVSGWVYRRLNGDETHQGRHMRMGSGEWQIQRIRLYDYE